MKANKFEVGKRIKAAIKNVMMVKEAAIELGLSEDALYRWFRGETTPTGKNLMRLCEITGTSSSYILRGENPDEPFPRYLEIMRLPPNKRAAAISNSAAEAVGITGFHNLNGARYNNPDMISYDQGEITEAELYRRIEKKLKEWALETENFFKREGLI